MCQLQRGKIKEIRLLNTIDDHIGLIKKELAKPVLYPPINDVPFMISSATKVLNIAVSVENRVRIHDNNENSAPIVDSFCKRSIFYASRLVNALYSFINMLMNVKKYFMANTSKLSKEKKQSPNQETLLKWSKMLNISKEQLNEFEVVRANLDIITKKLSK